MFTSIVNDMKGFTDGELNHRKHSRLMDSRDQSIRLPA